MQCPHGKLLVASPHQVPCANTTCSLEVDEDTCCKVASTCEKYKCPIGFGRKKNAHAIQCADANCTETDYLHCCAPLALCSSYRCPKGTAPKHIAATSKLYCAKDRCDEADTNACC